MRRLWLFTAVAVLVAACAQPPPLDASGPEIYEQVCSNCHGQDLSGGIGPDLGPDSNAAGQDDDFLRLTITRGRGRMPSFDSTLTEEQIDRVIDYLRSRQG